MRAITLTVPMVLALAGTARADWREVRSKLNDAGRNEGLGRTRDVPSDGLPYFEQCLKDLEEVMKAQDILKDHPDYAKEAAEIRPKCEAGIKQARGWKSGGGRTAPDDHDQGKAAVKAYNAASATFQRKDAEATELVAAQTQADECRRAVGQLIGLYVSSRSQEHYYNAGKHTLTTADGKKTLRQVDHRCKEIIVELGKRKIKGCGTKGVGVSQRLVTLTKWGSPGYSIDEEFEPGSCKGMPKRDSFPGASKKYSSRIKSICKKGVVVMYDDSWQEWSSTDGAAVRGMGGKCWQKGEMSFPISQMFRWPPTDDDYPSK